MTAHRIRLRGPWLLEPAASGERPSRTVRLPARWGELLEIGTHRVRLSRRFHRPTNLGPSDRVSLVVDELPEGAEVSLNGERLGLQAGDPAGRTIFPTRALEPTNLLTLEFEIGPKPAGDEPWGDVALLISSSLP